MTPQDISKAVDALVKKYDGQFVEAGGSANALNQCVDLANQYISEFLGQPKVLWTNAIDFPSRIGSKFEWVKNTPDGVPPKGALVIWEVPKDFGHIAVSLAGGTTSKFKSFDENYPTGSKCHVQEHTYDGVIGWLVFKSDDAEMLQITKKDFEKLVGNSGKWDQTVAYLEIGTKPEITSFDQVKSVIAGYKARTTDLQNQLNEVRPKLEIVETEISNLKSQLLDMRKDNKSLIDQYKSSVDDIVKELTEPKTDEGYIYLIEGDGYHKIGKAVAPKDRLATLQVGSPYPLKLVKTWSVSDMISGEYLVKQRFQDKLIRGEWYTLATSDVGVIDALLLSLDPNNQIALPYESLSLAGKISYLQSGLSEVSKAKGDALQQAADAKVLANNWESKYKELLGNKARSLTLPERLLVLFTGRIA